MSQDKEREAFLPCPHCGEQPLEHAIEPHQHSMSFGGVKMPDHAGSHVVECSCGAGMIDETREAVLARWNRRAALASQQAGKGEPSREMVRIAALFPIEHKLFADTDGKVQVLGAAQAQALLRAALSQHKEQP